MNDAPAPTVPHPALRGRTAYKTWVTEHIRYNDLDPNSHVNNIAINQFFEDGRVHFRDVNMPGDAILEGFVVVKFTVEYLAELSYPGDIEVGTTIMRVGGSSYTLGQGIFRGDTCVAAAEAVTVCVDTATKRPASIEGELRQALESNILEV